MRREPEEKRAAGRNLTCMTSHSSQLRWSPKLPVCWIDLRIGRFPVNSTWLTSDDHGTRSPTFSFVMPTYKQFCVQNLTFFHKKCSCTVTISPVPFFLLLIFLSSLMRCLEEDTKTSGRLSAGRHRQECACPRAPRVWFAKVRKKCRGSPTSPCTLLRAKLQNTASGIHAKIISFSGNFFYRFSPPPPPPPPPLLWPESTRPGIQLSVFC